MNKKDILQWIGNPNITKERIDGVTLNINGNTYYAEKEFFTLVETFTDQYGNLLDLPYISKRIVYPSGKRSIELERIYGGKIHLEGWVGYVYDNNNKRFVSITHPFETLSELQKYLRNRG